MRKANFKTLLAATLVVFAFLLGANRVQAQSVSTGATGGLYAYPAKVTFVSASEAEDILTVHVDALKAYVNSLPQGSPAYLVGYRASVYYRAILQSVQGGKNVPDAVVDGLGMFLTEYFNGASYSEKLGLRQEAIGMLSTANVPNNNTN